MDLEYVDASAMATLLTPHGSFRPFPQENCEANRQLIPEVSSAAKSKVLTLLLGKQKLAVQGHA